MEKKCTRCLIVKPHSEFSKAKSEKDGLQVYCIPCRREYSAEYRAKNKEKERVRHAKYATENKEKRLEWEREYRKRFPDKRREISKRFYYNHKEAERIRHRKWREKNPDQHRANYARWKTANVEYAKLWDAEYCRNNPEKVNAKNAKRRARMMQALVSWAETKEILALYAECQRISKETGIEYHVDHRIPLKHDLVCGLHCMANLRIITQKENLTKCNRFLPEEFDEVFL